DVYKRQEPNLAEYWARDYDSYLEMWRRTVRRIRSSDPKAEIVGPSICSYNAEWLQRFLLWAKSNDVLPDIVSWHEFNDPREIPAHASELRAFLKKNGIRIKRFSLNEIIGGHHLTKPGPTAQYLWAVEEADIESAAHACWEDEEKGVYGCFTDSLDGILTPKGKKPRSTWWVYRRYADLTGVLVQTEACSDIRAIAGRDDAKNQVATLIGCNGQAKLDVRIRFVNLNRMKALRDEVRVRVERIPDIGWEHLPEPQVIQDTVRPLFGSEITVIVPSLGPNDACFVQLCTK
ncbi:MAG: hypothetical protein N3B12_05530, partial [Armatimonadetes bacterium]|nr:hypothetical protein [Armatimonadota bacterium]